VPGSNHHVLCRRFGISAKTGYKWKARAEAAQKQGQPLSEALAVLFRRPLSSPRRSLPQIEETVVQSRREHPAWGGYGAEVLLGRTCFDSVYYGLAYHRIAVPAVNSRRQ